MFSRSSDVKLLRKYSSPWNISSNEKKPLPCIYEFLYKLKASEIHINFTRNTKVGSQVEFKVFYKDYTLHFYFQNKDSYEYWVELYQNKEKIATNEVSYEVTNALFRLLPKQLRKSFRSILLEESLPRKWINLLPYVNNFHPINGSNVKTPTILNLELLQAGAYPFQIPNSEKIAKTYYYFKI